MQLDGLGGRFPVQLSGAQRQRVGFARALAPYPKVLLLDEPFGALDTRVRAELRGWLRELHEATHLTTILVTHDQEEALELSDQIVVMDKGRVHQVGSPREIYDVPRTPFVASFVGTANVLRGQVKDGRASVGAMAIAVPDDIPEGSNVRAIVRYTQMAYTGLSEIGPFKVQKFITTDGFKYLLPNNEWVAFRASGTEPLIRCYIEAKTSANLKKLRNACRSLLE